jgi:hypothetical protein
MKKYLLILILCSVFGCGKEENKTETKYVPPQVNNPVKQELPPLPTPDELQLDSIDHVIISSAVSQYLFPPEEFRNRAHFFSPRGAAPKLDAEVVLVDSTKFNPPPKSVMERHNRLDPTDAYMTERLTALNQPGYRIDSNRIFSELIVNVMPIETLKKKGVLQKAYSTFPGGVIYVSKPSRNFDKNRAVVYFRVTGKGGTKEGLIWLRSETPVWNAYDIVKYE